MQKQRVHGVEHGPVRIEKAPFGLGETDVEAIPWLALREPSVEPWIPEGDFYREAPEADAPVDHDSDAPAVDAAEAGAEAIEADGSELPQSEEAEAAAADSTPEPEAPAGPSWEEHEAAMAEKLEQQAEALAEPFVAAASELRARGQRMNEELDQAILQMATAMAGAILRRECADSPDVLQASLKQALEVIGPVQELSLEVHPADLAVAREQAPDMATDIAGHAVQVSVSASDTVDRGTCIARFDRGVVDARWEARLGQFADAIRHQLEAGATQDTAQQEQVSDEANADNGEDV